MTNSVVERILHLFGLDEQAELSVPATAGAEVHAIGRIEPPPAVVVGSIQMIGLGAIRERLGMRWRRAAAMVDQAVEQILSANLSKADAFARLDPETYVVVFGSMTEPEARVLAEDLARRIHDKLCGTDLEEQVIVVRSFVETVRAAELVQRLTGHGAGAGPQVATPSPASDIGFRFAPIFHVRRDRVVAYAVQAVRQSTGQPVGADDMGEGAFDGGGTVDLDIGALHAAIDAHARLGVEGKETAFALHVHFSTVGASRPRDQFLRLARQIPQAMAKNSFMSLVGVPAGVPEGRLLELCTYLKPLSGGVGAEIVLDPKRIVLVAQAGFQAVGVRHHAHQQPSPEVTADLSEFVRRARSHRLATVFSGISTPAMARAAAETGFQYIAGPAVAPLLVLPEALAVRNS